MERLTREITVKDVDMIVTGDYKYTPEKRNTSSGDPGWPASEELELVEIDIIKESEVITAFKRGVTIKDIRTEFMSALWNS